MFTIQSQMRADNRVPWTPPEGKLVADVQKKWDELEQAEHARELARHEELKRPVLLYYSIAYLPSDFWRNYSKPVFDKNVTRFSSLEIGRNSETQR